MDIDLGTPPRRAQRRDDEQPLRVLVIGNFSGNALAQPAPPFIARRIDIDNFDAVMAAVKPQLELTIAGLGESRVRLGFASLEDFHPDALFRECAIFNALREKRALLSNPATFAGTAAGMLEAGKATSPLSSAEGEMFERLLGSSGGREAAPATQASVIQNLINRVVAPHIVADIAPEQSRYIASVDAAVATLMKSILHAPEFQALESGWRGARALLDETEGGEEIQIWVADAGLAALGADVAASIEDPTKGATFDLLVARAEKAADSQPWSIVIGNYLFSTGEDELRVLAVLGALCRRAGTPFIAGAASGLAGCESFGAQSSPASWESGAEAASRWRALRAQSFASSVALAAPRVLARLPYGKASDAIDSFAFEEIDDAAAHESFLWGNAAFALGRLLIRGFVARGWDMEPGDELELAELPAVVRGRGDDRRLQACGEAYVGERGGERLLDLGLVPVLSHEQRAAVRLMRVQSIAEPATSLAAAW